MTSASNNTETAINQSPTQTESMEMEKAKPTTTSTRLEYFLILALAFVLPLSRSAVTALTLLIPIIWLIRKRPWTQLQALLLTELGMALFLFISFIFLSLLWSDNLSHGYLIAEKYLYWLLLIPPVAYIVKPMQVQKVISAFLVGMTVSQTISWALYFGIWPFKFGASSPPSPFMTDIQYSVMLAITIAILITRLFGGNRAIFNRVLHSILLISAVISLFITGGKSGQLSFFIILPMAFILYTRLSPKFLIAATVLPIIIFLISYQLSHDVKNNVQLGIYELGEVAKGNYVRGTFGTRAGLALLSIGVFKENPIVGAGLGDNMIEAKKFLYQHHPDLAPALDHYTKFHMHNQYLSILTKTGLIGFTLMALLLYFYFKLPISNKDMSVLRTLIIMAFLAAFIGEPIWHKQFLTALFALLTGLFFVNEMKVNTNESHNTRKQNT